MVDIIVGMVIIVILMVAGLDFFRLAKAMQSRQERRLQAVYLANSTIEKLKYNTAAVTLNGTQGTWLSTGHHNMNDHQDVLVPPPGFTISYQVDFFYWPADPATIDRNYNRVTVTCTYGTGDGTGQVQLIGYVF